ncbi:MAG: molecular chaperone TorD family protein [Syntrophomonas sp.]|nr:molecular chaperone TorD family protein [Syntrophomonas sp.]
MTGLSWESKLLWTAKDMFRYPDQENMPEMIADLRQLLDWAQQARKESFGPETLTSAADNADLDQLQVDFTALFINAFPSCKAHPFAGWYEGDAIIMGPSDNRVRQFYSHYGVECDQLQVPADHIMVELEFMAIMAEKFEETGDAFYFAAMQEMMNQHLEHWVLIFLKNIEKNARTNFYRDLAAVLLILFKELTIELKEVA